MAIKTFKRKSDIFDIEIFNLVFNLIFETRDVIDKLIKTNRFFFMNEIIIKEF